ncbi:MAG: PAS domain-containing protein [Alphaproteobacteria bacterium]|nr:PAS domain-containing protein [Alphaproteobacteria bacterium]
MTISAPDRLTEHDRRLLAELLPAAEGALMARILVWAECQGYTRYTSTLAEAWRLSIVGLTQSILAIDARTAGVSPEFGPDESFANDEACLFGIDEARKHRKRGVSLAMFLGLFKYYRQTYQEFVQERSEFEDPVTVGRFVGRVFDRIEIAFATEWAGIAPERQIHELADTNRTLANEKNKFLTVFESLPSPVLFLDRESGFDTLNQAAAALFLPGVGSGGRYYGHHEHPLLDTVLGALGDLLRAEGRRPLRAERHFATAHGDRMFDIRIDQLADVSHKLAGYVVMMDDVTERRAAERALADHQTALEIQVAARTAELERSNADLREFAYAASHDLQEPLRMIGSYLKLIERRMGGELTGELREFFDFAIDGANRMSRMIGDLLQYSRVSSRPHQLGPVPLGEAVAEALSNLASRIEETGGVIEVGELPELRADRGQMVSLMQNLIGNALKYHAEDRPPRVRVSASRGPDQCWTIDIADNGIGIAAEHLGRIFQVFQRLHPRDQYDGTGIGLAICRKVAERHGGRIAVASTPGVGSTFSVILPDA